MQQMREQLIETYRSGRPAPQGKHTISIVTCIKNWCASVAGIFIRSLLTVLSWPRLGVCAKYTSLQAYL